MNIFDNPYEENRINITHLLNKKFPNGIGIEIGVFKGVFAKKVLDNWNCSKYYLVDLWDNINTIDNNYDEEWAKDKQQHLNNFNETLKNIENYKNKVQIIKNYSHLASNDFSDNSFDFIYIDANHSYDAVKNDLETWFPKLKNGCIFMGDDYHINDIEMCFGSKFGVKKAVDEFCYKNDKNISLNYSGDWYYQHNSFYIPSRNWYFIK